MNQVTYKKKLIEVSLPLSEINDASAHDKMPGIGPHPKSMLHWWAPLPLPCARAILFSTLVDDPSNNKNKKQAAMERNRLHKIIKDLISKNGTDLTTISAARAEISKSLGNERPLFIDPFCGGGSIPLEAARLGMDVIAIDLNPVAAIKTKAQIEIIPQYVHTPSITNKKKDTPIPDCASGLAEDVRYYGQIVLEKVRSELSEYFPKVSFKENEQQVEKDVITWHWARTITCPNPTCRAETALVRNFSLSNRKTKQIYTSPTSGNKKQLGFKIVDAMNDKSKPPPASISRSGGRCLHCNQPFDLKYVREEGKKGNIGIKLMAISVEGIRGRTYLPPNKEQEETAINVIKPKVIDTHLPDKALGFRVQAYGITTHADLYTARQLLVLENISKNIISIRQKIIADYRKFYIKGHNVDDIDLKATNYAKAICMFLAFAVCRLADYNCSLSMWKPTGEQQIHLFTGGKIPMVWDFVEGNILGNRGICWTNSVEITAAAITATRLHDNINGKVVIADCASEISKYSSIVVSTRIRHSPDFSPEICMI